MVFHSSLVLRVIRSSLAWFAGWKPETCQSVIEAGRFTRKGLEMSARMCRPGTAIPLSELAASRVIKGVRIGGDRQQLSTLSTLSTSSILVDFSDGAVAKA